MDTDARDGAAPAYRPALIGVGLAALAAGLGFFPPEHPTWFSAGPLTFAVLGLLTTGFAVSRRPKDAGVLALGTATALLAIAGIHPEWDSVRLPLAVMAGLSAFAAVLVLLPPAAQKVAVSLLVVFHFCGILTAITSPPTTPWMTDQLWKRFFRPHLMFSYVNNAYQFYSPQPGPAGLLWFCVETTDGEKGWYKVPRTPESHLDPLAVEYFRRLSITEQANQNVELRMGPPQLAVERRNLQLEIPYHPELLPALQYHLLQDQSRRLIESYVRYVGQTFGGPEKVKGIKVYRVEHRMLSPEEFARGDDPFDKTTYFPYYLGEYHVPADRKASDQWTLKDPDEWMLYWLVPIIRQPKPPGTRGDGQPYKNFLEYHAGRYPFAG
jgi:hypothetical protein